MRRIILILFFCSTIAQAHPPGRKPWLGIPDDVLHFYVPFAINEITYSTQYCLFPKQKVGFRLLISSAVTAGACYAKEVWDNNRPGGTGFNKPDLATGIWSIPVYAETRIIINDCRKPKEIDTTMYQDLAPVKINDSTYTIAPVITPTTIIHD